MNLFNTTHPRPRHETGLSRAGGAISLLAFAAAIFVAAAVAPQVALAEEPAAPAERSTRYYFGVYAAGSWGTADLDRTGFNATSDSDSSFFFGANLGLERALAGPFRIRLEIDGTNERRFEVALPGGTGGDRVDLEAWTMNGNFWIVYPLSSAFPDTPIIRRISALGGGGVGFSRMTVDVDATGPTLDSSYQKARFAWQGGVGAAFEVTRWLGVDVRYQYADLGRATATIVDGGGTPQGEIDVDLGAHELLGGFRFVY